MPACFSNAYFFCCLLWRCTLSTSPWRVYCPGSHPARLHARSLRACGYCAALTVRRHAAQVLDADDGAGPAGSAERLSFETFRRLLREVARWRVACAGAAQHPRGERAKACRSGSRKRPTACSRCDTTRHNSSFELVTTARSWPACARAVSQLSPAHLGRSHGPTRQSEANCSTSCVFGVIRFLLLAARLHWRNAHVVPRCVASKSTSVIHTRGLHVSMLKSSIYQNCKQYTVL